VTAPKVQLHGPSRQNTTSTAGADSNLQSIFFQDGRSGSSNGLLSVGPRSETPHKRSRSLSGLRRNLTRALSRRSSQALSDDANSQPGSAGEIATAGDDHTDGARNLSPVKPGSRRRKSWTAVSKTAEEAFKSVFNVGQSPEDETWDPGFNPGVNSRYINTGYDYSI
jgi:hypothetical protein